MEGHSPIAGQTIEEEEAKRQKQRSLELLDLLDRYCEKKALLLYPLTRINPTRTPNEEVNTDYNNIWTLEDVESVLNDNNVQYDEHLGLKFYHTDPINLIQTACKVKNKLFIDYEFNVHESFSIRIKASPNYKKTNCRITPGIITPQNIQDLHDSGKPKRIQRAIKYLNKAIMMKHPSSASKITRPSEWYWKRGSTISKNEHSFATSSSIVCAQNVIQGKFGNCGFCSGFASIAAQFSEMIENAFGFSGSLSATGSGAISICLYPNGKKRYLLLDDYVLCTRTTTAAGGTMESSPSMHSKIDGNDLWIRLLEKVFVKIQSSYTSLDGHYKWNSLYRHPAKAMQLLTGAPIALELHYDYQRHNKDEIYNALLATEGICARVTHGRLNHKGLRASHGYSLLWIGAIANVKLVCVRNPHGHGSYTGEFGRGINSWSCTDRAMAVAKELNMGGGGESKYEQSPIDYLRRLLLSSSTSSIEESCCKEDNGIFLIDFDIFVQCFPITSIVGPITSTKNVKNGDNAADQHHRQLKEFPIPNCLHILRGMNISRAPAMLNVASGTIIAQ